MSDEKTYTHDEFMNIYKISNFQFDSILEFDKIIVSGPKNEPKVKWYWDERLHAIMYLSFVKDNWHIHRDKKPALIEYRKIGSIKLKWYIFINKLHREDGPAIIKYDKLGNVTSTEYWCMGDKQEQLTTKRVL